MHIIDWIILCVPMAIVVTVALKTRSYMKSVADFMSGGRVAGRYLIAVAKGEMQAGAVVFVASFEVFSQAGFVFGWWSKLLAPLMLIVAISGFVIYRYRQTRVMTLAQFFEVRYNKSIRVFTGCLGFLAGILNFGIIPIVGSSFMVYFLGLPTVLHIGSLSIPTNIILMAIFLSFTVLMTLSGGIITVMVTDCVEGIISQLIYLVLVASLIWMFDWSQINQVLMDRPPGESLLNPFDTHEIKDFNFWYIVMQMAMAAYATMAWQNASAYNSAALNPHESRMGGLLGKVREMGKHGVVILLAMCAMTYLAHPSFANQSTHAKELIGQISEPQLQKQMEIPIAVSEMLPIGIKGLFCAVLLMGIFGGDSTHLHSWGGIFVQDVLVPLRKKPFTPKEHIWFLRLSVLSVALFAFLFGCFFKQTEYVNMWWQVTTGVFVAGAGAAIIGGLYWKKGTAAGAWASVVTGAALSLAGIICRQIYGNAFPLNGMKIYFTVALICVTVYVVVSLLTCKEDFDMDRMLHRGKYALPDTDLENKKDERSRLQKMIGIDKNFSKSDRWIAGGLFGWSALWFLMASGGSIWNLIDPWAISTWSTYWHIFGTCVPVFLIIMTGIWFTWGGVRDIRSLFDKLKSSVKNDLDNGMVVNHQNLAEVSETTAIQKTDDFK